MKTLDAFKLPIKGLKDGIHDFEFSVDQTFLEQFEASPVKEGKVACQVKLDKRPNMMVLDFDITGTVKTLCDRCLANIDLPIGGNQELIVKYEEEGARENPDYVLIEPDSSHLDVSSFVYEFVCLAIPLTKTYDCQSEEEPPCDFKSLALLENNSDENTDENNPIWDVLKDLK
ncbi:MAG: DUF177 domain-containing protein [Saprospiraceae bacterium]|nr:DUF177 domain-containing protein [Saprospiraceae bacterium]